MKVSNHFWLMLIGAATAIGITACTNDNSDEPGQDGASDLEKAMVKEQMTWRLDSTLVIYNYQKPNETREMVYPKENEPTWAYTFYPSAYKFPSDLIFHDEEDNSYQISELYNDDHCKFIFSVGDQIISAGYLCYHNGQFTFNGVDNEGWIVFMMREADTDWSVETWTCTFNVSVDDDGTVLERNIEYYSRID